MTREELKAHCEKQEEKMIPMWVIEDIKAEIAHNFESIVGKYTSDTPLRDKAYVKCARNEAREECLAIIDKHIGK